MRSRKRAPAEIIVATGHGGIYLKKKKNPQEQNEPHNRPETSIQVGE